jgi:hypothetical protein
MDQPFVKQLQVAVDDRERAEFIRRYFGCQTIWQRGLAQIIDAPSRSLAKIMQRWGAQIEVNGTKLGEIDGSYLVKLLAREAHAAPRCTAQAWDGAFNRRATNGAIHRAKRLASPTEIRGVLLARRAAQQRIAIGLLLPMPCHLANGMLVNRRKSHRGASVIERRRSIAVR